MSDRVMGRAPRRRAIPLVAVLAGVGLLAAVVLRPSGAALAQRGVVVAPTPVGPQFCGMTSDGGSVRLQLSFDRTRVEWMEFHTTTDVSMSTLERCEARPALIVQEGDNKGQFIYRCDIANSLCYSRNVDDRTPIPPPPTHTPAPPSPPLATREPSPPAPREPRPEPSAPREPEPDPRNPRCAKPPCVLEGLPTNTPRVTPRFPPPRSTTTVCREVEVKDVLVTGKLITVDYAEGTFDFLIEKYPRRSEAPRGSFNRDRVIGTWQAWHPLRAPCP